MIGNSSLFINKHYMMNLFSESKAILPPFQEFVMHKHEENQHRCVRDGSSSPKICYIST